MALTDLTKESVEAALQEYDSLGRDGFLTRYGFADAKRYWIVRDGERYPSKAIAGVAHKYVSGEPLMSNSFTGGEGSVVRRLKSLGFNVQSHGRNPAWSRDELILALDLYFTNPATPPDKESAPVHKLSALLNKLHRLNGTVASDTLRNPNGVYMKMMNLRALDPAFTTKGRVGMQAGGALEKVVWAEFAHRRADLAASAAAIRQAVENANEDALASLPVVEPYEGEEGGVIIRLHKRYERDRKLVSEKRKEARALGELTCEVCGFDFKAAYGSLGEEFIEVHHTKPVHSLTAGSKTKLSDLALLCSNCHRMAHRRSPIVSLSEIRMHLRQRWDR